MEIRRWDKVVPPTGVLLAGVLTTNTMSLNAAIRVLREEKSFTAISPHLISCF